MIIISFDLKFDIELNTLTLSYVRGGSDNPPSHISGWHYHRDRAKVLKTWWQFSGGSFQCLDYLVSGDTLSKFTWNLDFNTPGQHFFLESWFFKQFLRIFGYEVCIADFGSGAPGSNLGGTKDFFFFFYQKDIYTIVRGLILVCGKRL